MIILVLLLIIFILPHWFDTGNVIIWDLRDDETFFAYWERERALLCPWTVKTKERPAVSVDDALAWGAAISDGIEQDEEWWQECKKDSDTASIKY